MQTVGPNVPKKKKVKQPAFTLKERKLGTLLELPPVLLYREDLKELERHLTFDGGPIAVQTDGHEFDRMVAIEGIAESTLLPMEIKRDNPFVIVKIRHRDVSLYLEPDAGVAGVALLQRLREFMAARRVTWPYVLVCELWPMWLLVISSSSITAAISRSHANHNPLGPWISEWVLWPALGCSAILLSYVTWLSRWSRIFKSSRARSRWAKAKKFTATNSAAIAVAVVATVAGAIVLWAIKLK